MKMTKKVITIDTASRAANAGEDTALAGRPRKSNPYPSFDRLHAWWDAGWLSVLPSEVVSDDAAKIRKTQ